MIFLYPFLWRCLKKVCVDALQTTGKRGAVRNTNSGLPVDHSGPGLRVGPTNPATADRKSEACPPGFDLSSSLSIKVVRGPGTESPATRAQRAACCGAQRRNGFLLLTKYRLIATAWTTKRLFRAYRKKSQLWNLDHRRK